MPFGGGIRIHSHSIVDVVAISAGWRLLVASLGVGEGAFPSGLDVGGPTGKGLLRASKVVLDAAAQSAERVQCKH